MRALAAAQKSKAGAPLYSRLINRPAGRVLAALAHWAGLSPDQVTVLSACCTYLGIILIAVWEPSVGAAVLVSALLMLGYALDSADGQLARLRHGGSRAGEWLDHVADVIKLSTIHLAVAVGLFRFSLDHLAGPGALLVPLAFSAVQNIHFFGYILTYQLRHQGGTPLARDEGRAGFLKSALSVPTDYGLMCLVLALRFAPTVFLWVYGLMLVGYAAYVALALPKWYLELRRGS
ncbi:MAG: CDP-alcohol phosphatidyltransferase family protein [Actinomyces sp.]|uniref:CDP-alcohol phosphatidyltransferase family protein n=1 Tax=Actinomyces sp. TaxID=29317 RepID=UPI0026DABB6B|nr:CDP-alcohol phosphatidyltransferase family protein [Actinomyces sp.]MDO4243479.1 CDP-alcohol phosphatidyltransferase family protein [Actinomyces sp.]